jgi:hypothetical protein
MKNSVAVESDVMPTQDCPWDDLPEPHDTERSGPPDDPEFATLKELDELLRALPVPRIPDDLDDPWI